MKPQDSRPVPPEVLNLIKTKNKIHEFFLVKNGKLKLKETKKKYKTKQAKGRLQVNRRT